jgi:hypothetical protein
LVSSREKDVTRNAHRMGPKPAWPAGALLCIALAACGDDAVQETGGVAGVSGTPCTQGTSFSCFIPGCREGRQLCQADGFLGRCTCRDVPQAADGGAMRDASATDAAVDPPDGATGSPTDGGAGREDAAADGGPDSAVPEPRDCEDDLGGYCIASAPNGWTGPVLVYEGTNDAPSCGGHYPDEVVSGGGGLVAPATTCSTCTCSGGCGDRLNFETGPASNCNNDCTTQISSSCAGISPSCLSGLGTGYLETKVPNNAATCSPSAQNPTLPAADWATNALACAPATALTRSGCGRGQVCAPEAPFAGEICILRDGDVPCPQGPYDDRRVYYTAIDDTRTCSACTCNADCNYTWYVFDTSDATCSTPLLTLTQENDCVPVNPSSGTIRVGVDVTGTCQPGGGQPTGSAQGQGAVTVCCY